MRHDHGLTITHRSHSTRVQVLVVAGDLDHHTAPRLREALDGVRLERGAGLVIDLSALTFCDSTGISVLVAAHQYAQNAGAVLALAGLDADLAHVFRIMGLDRLFSSYDDAEKAIAALQ
ncbi:anti-sigma factor antagonist [Planobispora rosea]|uniref:Anti-sigma factor antagonist n=1 Tax=Planobispora rosea TaxID=35762 RepID=A0A8J3S6S5_PLARO|nr:STAS domain-containing protein [Planobispora rosea]GGS89111.1 anti-sigma factor antagonist [Planobispora rosea]GIH87780.1 anti-sigma factor antagonist [Planobispora rosea]